MKNSSGWQFAYGDSRSRFVCARENARASRGSRRHGGNLRGDYSGFAGPRGGASHDDARGGAGRCVRRYGLTEEERDALLAQNEVLRQRGALVVSALNTATTVRVWNGKPAVSDGAFASSNVPSAGPSVVEAACNPQTRDT